MGYYEHEITVKIIDGVLAHEQDWVWFVQYTEENFEVELKADSVSDALNSFREIEDVFGYLSRIRGITNQVLPITKRWLKEVDLLAQYYNGTLDLDPDTIESGFAKIMRLLIYSGKIYGQIKNSKYYYYADIYKVRNLKCLETLDLFEAEEQTILRLIDEIPLNLEQEKQTFLDNINGNILPADQSFLDRHKNDFNNANCFSYATIVDDDIRTWEERELLRMLAVSVKDGEITPKIRWNDGIFPDYTVWTKDLVSYLISYFRSPDATFILETVSFLLHDETPSADTVNKHFALLYELSESTEPEKYRTKMRCSSLEIILAFFSGKLQKLIAEESYAKYGKVLNKLYDNDCIHLLGKICNNGAITDKALVHKLQERIKQRRDAVEEIGEQSGFLEYIQDTQIRRIVGNSHIDVLIDKFNSIIATEEGVMVAHLFLQYFLFLLQVKNNKDITPTKISAEIIRIRALWQNVYYAPCCEALHTFNVGPIEIPNEYSGQMLNLILRAPVMFASGQMLLREEQLVDRMQTLSESPFSIMFSAIMIEEDFPAYPVLKLDDKHPIDQIYAEYVDKIRRDYEHKFLNSFSAKEYIEGIFNGIKRGLMFNMELFDDVKVLYDAVAQQNPEYGLIDYSSDVRLAHITQLFPILERRVRDFGELCGIVPICEDMEKYHRLKEPDTVLKTILQQIDNMGGSILDAPDIYFIHFCMFAENGLNIRNACIHGLNYCQGNQLVFALKVTLVALYMIGWRINLALENMSKLK